MSRAKMIAWAAVGTLVLAGLWLWGRTGEPQFYAAEVEVRAPANQVFPYLLEPAKLQQWISGLRESRRQNGHGPEVGAKSIDVIEQEGRRVEVESVITRLEKNQLLQVKLHSPRFDAVNHLDLSSTATGTKVTQNFTITYKGMARLASLFGQRDRQQQLDADLARLKQAVEQSAAPPTTAPGATSTPPPPATPSDTTPQPPQKPPGDSAPSKPPR